MENQSPVKEVEVSNKEGSDSASGLLAKLKFPCDASGSNTQTEPNIDRNPDYIVFKLPFTAMRDSAIYGNYSNDKDRAVASMVRDLQVVCSHHMKLWDARTLFPVSCVTPLNFRHLPKEKIPLCGLIDVVDKLTSLQAMFSVTLDGTVVPPVPLSSGTATPGGGFRSGPVWPSNTSGIYMSRLMCRYLWCIGTVDPQHLEIADYCLAPNANLIGTEPLFRCAGGAPVVRDDLKSMDFEADIYPSVVNAWAQTCLGVWKTVGRTFRTCLSVAVKDTTNEQILPQQWELWLSWINHCSIDMTKAEQICIPLAIGDQYNMLYVNFRTRLVQCIDTNYSSERSDWDEVAEKSLALFWELLQYVGDRRVIHRREFTYEVVYPHWSTTIHDPDSGLTVMHLIDVLGEDNIEFRTMRLNEEHMRVQMRIAMCATIVRSPINLHRDEVLKNVREFIVSKNDGTIKLTPQMDEFGSHPNTNSYLV